jgi:2-desacetyl-2-hydroxyethyl bacteriochlorophyllide A dehydrogenase
MSKAHTLYFVSPRQVEVRETVLPAPGSNEVLVETICSAVSAGTEMLVYRGEFPRQADANDSISSDLKYPLAYGYACAGRIVRLGNSVGRDWLGKTVFAFQSHTSHFVAAPETLLPIPDSVSPETSCFLPNAETAVNLVQDAAPLLGERVLVLGQGVVGLLTASLLTGFPLDMLVTADHYELRRKASAGIGNTVSLDSSKSDFVEKARQLINPGADLTLELSGSPSALNDAIALTRFSGRVVIGSWYGQKKAEVNLGGAFHRSRIRLFSSQVSTIAPELSGRWDKARRFEVAWNALERIQPEKWITHRFPIERAGEAYRMLDGKPGEAIQIIFQYIGGAD